jgi:GNAT superfamily N-acetyltransferase
MELLIEPALIEDLAEILALQKLAYQEEAEIYQDYTILPLTQTLEDIELDFSKQVFLKAVAEGTIVGSVRAFQQGDTCFIGRLLVHPAFQNQGIGSKLMKKIEEQFTSVKRYELFTGSESRRNLYLYQKLNYRRFKVGQISDMVTLVYLEKVVT